MMSIGIQLAERGFATDTIIRYGIRKLLQDRLNQIQLGIDDAIRVDC